MGMQKHHDVANGLLLGPAGGYFSRAELSDPRDIPQLLGDRFDDFESSCPERADDSLRQLRTDAANHSRAEIFLDAFSRGRRGGFEKVGFELQPVGAIGRPNADGVYELSRRYRRGVPDDRDEVALTARLHLQDGEAIFLIVKCHPFDRADERFTQTGRVGCRPQDASWLPKDLWADYSKSSWRRSDDRAAAGTPLIAKCSGVLADPRRSSDFFALVPDFEFELETLKTRDHSAEFVPGNLTAIDDEQWRAPALLRVPINPASNHQRV